MPVPEQRARVDRHLLRDTAYARLCEAIVEGTLAPGEALHDTELCGWLGLSRTPVREALSRLREEGLVEMEPQRFTRVSPLTRREVFEIAPLLATLHGLATELAVPRLRESQIRAMRIHHDAFVAGLHSRDPETARAADERFHAVFVEASGNAELARMLARLTPRLRRLEHHGRGMLPGRRAVAQHEVVITRAEIGDAPGAAAAARANWMTYATVLESPFAQSS